jgi:hypothetical protein
VAPTDANAQPSAFKRALCVLAPREERSFTAVITIPDAKSCVQGLQQYYPTKDWGCWDRLNSLRFHSVRLQVVIHDTCEKLIRCRLGHSPQLYRPVRPLIRPQTRRTMLRRIPSAQNTHIVVQTTTYRILRPPPFPATYVFSSSEHPAVRHTALS